MRKAGSQATECRYCGRRFRFWPHAEVKGYVPRNTTNSGFMAVHDRKAYFCTMDCAARYGILIAERVGGLIGNKTSGT